MDGTLVARGACWACKAVFSFDPDTVPSVPIDPQTGLPPDVGGTPPERAIRQPLCENCVAQLVTWRAEAGKPVWEERS